MITQLTVIEEVIITTKRKKDFVYLQLLSEKWKRNVNWNNIKKQNWIKVWENEIKRHI